MQGLYEFRLSTEIRRKTFPAKATKKCYQLETRASSVHLLFKSECDIKPNICIFVNEGNLYEPAFKFLVDGCVKVEKSKETM